MSKDKPASNNSRKANKIERKLLRNELKRLPGGGMGPNAAKRKSIIELIWASLSRDNQK